MLKALHRSYLWHGVAMEKLGNGSATFGTGAVEGVAAVTAKQIWRSEAAVEPRNDVLKLRT